jgi:hypothetical protein
MSEEFIDVSFMKRTEIVQAIRNSESLDNAVTLMNGFAANGWLHLWDDAKHPDGSSVQSQWRASQQAEIDRLKGQRDRLYEELKEARDEVANQASAAHELLPYKPHRYEAYKNQLDRIDAIIAEIEAGK